MRQRHDTSSALAMAISLALGLALAVFGGRRAVMLAAALRPRRDPGAGPDPPPPVAIIVPIFNEAAQLPELLASLERLDYPRDRLSIALIDDGSTDGSSALIRAWAEHRPEVTAVRLQHRSGKAEALNAAGAARGSGLIVVCDADLRPRPGLLHAFAPHFAEPRVGAVAAYLAPANHARGVVAGYAALESWVHQLVTSAAKDRLGLDPPTHGCAAYRASALESISWFSGPGPGEDVRVSVALSRNGWRTRFARNAVADNRVASSWATYWRQHIRWTRNLLLAPGAAPAPAPRERDRGTIWSRCARAAERGLSAAGYADRLVLAAAVVLAIPRRVPRWLVGAYPALIASELIVAVVKAGCGRELPRYLLIAASGSAVDLLASTAAIWAHLRRRPHRWPAGEAPRPGSPRPLNR